MTIQDAGGKVDLLEAAEARSADLWDSDGLIVRRRATRRTISATQSAADRRRSFRKTNYCRSSMRCLRRRGIRCGAGEKLELISCNNERPHFSRLQTPPPTIRHSCRIHRPARRRAFAVAIAQYRRARAHSNDGRARAGCARPLKQRISSLKNAIGSHHRWRSFFNDIPGLAKFRRPCSSSRNRSKLRQWLQLLRRQVRHT